MIHAHDSAPAHFSLIARHFLNVLYPERWIGRSSPISWPPRLPDINPIDFFSIGHLKTLVYAAGPI